MKTYRTFPGTIAFLDHEDKGITINSIHYSIEDIEVLDETFGYQRLQVLLKSKDNNINNNDYLLELNLQFDASSEDMSITYIFGKIKKTGKTKNPLNEDITTYDIIKEIEITEIKQE